MLKDSLRFFFHFLKNAKRTASVVPTSLVATKEVCHEIDFSSAITVVEFGPGTGNVAEEVAKHMNVSSRLILIEANPEFVVELRKKFSNDLRVTIVEGLAQHAESILGALNIPHVDVVLANIPFTFFDERTRIGIVQAAKHVLKTGGVFIVFPFTTTVRPYLQDIFPEVREKIVWHNLPPLRVFIAKKEA